MLLVVGANGQLGSELRSILGTQAHYVDRNELDITDSQKVKTFFAVNKYDWIINCAAYTAVDKAEEDAKQAYEINANGPKNLALSGIPMIHISTDYVFDGCNCYPYLESDKINPQSVYGKSKAQGEENVLQYSKTAIIIRTSWLYSAFGNNFVKTMQRLGNEKQLLNVVFDQIGTPTYAKDLAQIIVDILPKAKSGSKEIYHFSNEGVCSWYDFAIEIMRQSKLSCQVDPIESKDYLTKAVRPFYSVLNKGKIKKEFELKIRHWSEALAECMIKLSQGEKV